jgi:CO/xanthine dehydrogenase FAD-binding subunit
VKVDVARDLDGALALLAAGPTATVLNGGTDLMVEINFGRKRPEAIVAIDRIAELREIFANGTVRVGAGVTFTSLLDRDCGSPALREAARTVGSPQIRNAATIGGNVATSSPAGDSLPVLAALDATVHLRSTRGARAVPFAEFMTGPKKNVRAADELVTALEWADAGEAQVFMKVGTRNAMVIAVAGLALVADRARKRIGIGLGSCGPTILRAPDAERFATGLFDESGWRRFVPSDAACAEFGAKVAAAGRPIDDVRGTAAYRRHVLAVMGARALARVAQLGGIA